MSNLKVATLNAITSTTGVPELKIRRVEREILGEARTVRVNVPGKAGAWTYPEEPGDRRIRLIGWLQAEGVSAKRTAIHNLAEWLGATTEVVNLSVDDETDRYYEVTVDGWDVDTSERHPQVVIDFVGGAYGLASSLTTQTEAVSGSPDSGTFNSTDDYAAEPVIEITPTNGTVTGFTLTLNGDTIEWSGGTIVDDDTITISCVSDTVTLGTNDDMELTGFFDPDSVSMAAVSVSGFPEIIVGTNTWSLSWTGTATTITLEFTWRERFL